MNATRIAAALGLALAAGSLTALPAHADPAMVNRLGVCTYTRTADGDLAFRGFEEITRADFPGVFGPTLGDGWGAGYFAWDEGVLRITMATDGEPSELCRILKKDYQAYVKSQQAWVCHYALPESKATSTKQVPITDLVEGFKFAKDGSWAESYLPSIYDPGVYACDAALEGIDLPKPPTTPTDKPTKPAKDATPTKPADKPSKPADKPAKDADKPSRGVEAKTGVESQTSAPVAAASLALAAVAVAGGIGVSLRRH